MTVARRLRRMVTVTAVSAAALVAGQAVAEMTGHAGGSTPELSERETEVVRLIATGYSNKEIAAELAVSVKTVETYKARAAEKLGLGTRAAIVRYAAREGWLAGP